jgi:methylenetetrahydrofolate--tRNA-(uracil-5-)-methyltransferase
MIPGLEGAEFARYGQMHRNTFIYSPGLLYPTLQSKFRDDLFFSGQITGVEGYCGNIATGLLAGLNAARFINGDLPLILPPTTMLGALITYITQANAENFQPMKANFGILPPLEESEFGGGKNKRLHALKYAERAHRDLSQFLSTINHANNNSI